MHEQLKCMKQTGSTENALDNACLIALFINCD